MIQVHEVAHHRNGICGQPFYVIRFTDAEGGNMVGIVFEETDHCAVLDIDKLAAGDIALGSNSWRGDHYEKILRQAIEDYEKGRSGIGSCTRKEE